MKLALATALAIGTIQLASAKIAPLPHVIDHRKMPKGTCSKTSQAYYDWGLQSFNMASEILSTVAAIKYHFGIRVAVETGTFKGATTFPLGFLFDEVHTIENHEEGQEADLGRNPGIQLYWGSSSEILPDLLPTLMDEKYIFFYLDAHWFDYLPLLDEIEIIGRTHKNKAIIMIDDCYVPWEPTIGHDTYKGIPISDEYMKPALALAYDLDGYTTHYIIPKNV
jgi:hypothetical protein